MVRAGSVLFVLAALGSGCGGTARELPGSRADRVVYGTDDRAEIEDGGNDAVRSAALGSVLALTTAAALASGPSGSERWDLPTAGTRFGLCPDERFGDQPSLADCTAVLVGADVALTAAHCLPSGEACADLLFVAGWALDARGHLPSPGGNDLYACRRVFLSEGPADIALFELDRAVEGGHPARRGRSPAPGEWAFTAGFPLGTPLKVTAGPITRAATGPDAAFDLAVDAFTGNSGSPVFDGSGALLGLLTRGHRDFDRDPSGCWRTRTLPEPAPGDTAEQAVSIDAALSAVCDADERSERCAELLSTGAGAENGCAISRPRRSGNCAALALSLFASSAARRRRSRGSGCQSRSALTPNRLRPSIRHPRGSWRDGKDT